MASAVPMIRRCFAHQHPITDEERRLIPQGQEPGVPWTESLPDLPDAERGRLEGVLPLPLIVEPMP